MNLRDEIDEAFEEFLLDTKYYLGGMYELPGVIAKYVKNTIKEKKNQKKQNSSKKDWVLNKGSFFFV